MKFTRQVVYCQTRFLSNASKPFEAIPGPPGNGLPFLGHTHMLVKKPHGFGKQWLNVKEMVQKYKAEDARLLRFRSPVFNPENGHVVFLLDPQDVGQVHKNEGKYPKRGPAFEPYKLMRQARPDIFPVSTGVLTEDGEKWHDLRSKVQQDIMRPTSALHYIDTIQEVGDEFMEFIRQTRSKDDNVIKNCLPEFYKFTYESIALIAMETRLGCLKIPMDPELERIFNASKVVFDSFGGLLNNPSWKFLPKRWNKTYRESEDALHLLFDFSKKHLEAAKARFENESKDISYGEMSVLQRLLERCGPESSYPLIMAIDLLIAGIDTTGNTMAFLLYCLATNPDKQEKLRQECQSLGQNLTVKDLNQLKYLKACMLEANRLTPTINIFFRVMPEDIVLRGYHIPKGTQLTWSPFIFQEQFAEHEKFLPERWLDNKKEICPFAVRQFSHGPRMCIGKRFAELELLTVTNKLMNNFEIKCINSRPMTISQVLVNEPDEPLDFQFNDL